MPKQRLPEQVRSAASRVGRADIVVGVCGRGDHNTIAHALETADAGLTKYFPQFMSALVSSEIGLSAAPLQATSVGLSGESGIRDTFAIAKCLGARACVVLDGTVRSVTPEWLDLLLRPLLFTGYDFVVPHYRRRRYEGTLTNGILYPLTRALYGVHVAPVGADFGISARLLSGSWNVTTGVRTRTSG